MNKIQVNLSEEEVNEQSKSWGMIIVCVLAIVITVSETVGPSILHLFN